MALYFEMRQLPWFKAKWKKAEEDLGKFLAYLEMARFIQESD